jgi:hypothetical protein
MAMMEAMIGDMITYMSATTAIPGWEKSEIVVCLEGGGLAGLGRLGKAKSLISGFCAGTR